jgi:hypothetical protein
MSSRRSRSRQSGSSRITDEQISDLVSKLQDLLPEARLRGNDRVRTNSLALSFYAANDIWSLQKLYSPRI